MKYKKYKMEVFMKIDEMKQYLEKAWNEFLDQYEEDRPDLTCPFLPIWGAIYCNTPKGEMQISDFASEFTIEVKPEGFVFLFEKENKYTTVFYDWFAGKAAPEIVAIHKTEVYYEK